MTRQPTSALGAGHLVWVAVASLVGFLVPATLSARLPPTAYHAVYFAVVTAFLLAYARGTELRVRAILGRRWRAALVLAAVFGAVMVRRALTDPTSSGTGGLPPTLDVLWRGVIYGTVDGLLLSSLPWVVAWRALGGESGSRARRVLASSVALGGVLLVTTAYHLGYADFRGVKVVEANVGNALMTAPTLLAMNPVASPLVHATLHVAVVLHDPQSELFLPPHGRARGRPPRD